MNWSAISTVTIARNKSKSICVEATTVMATLEKLLADEALCACSDRESFAIRSGGVSDSVPGLTGPLSSRQHGLSEMMNRGDAQGDAGEYAPV